MGGGIMANYTIALYDLLSDPHFELFDFDYPFYTIDESRKKEFEQKFIMNYMRYEIGFETGFDFKHELKTRLHMVMPYYKQLYESEVNAAGIDFLLNKDLMEEFTRTLETESETNSDSKLNTDTQSQSDSRSDSTSNMENSGSNLDNGLSNANADTRKTSHSKDNTVANASSSDQVKATQSVNDQSTNKSNAQTLEKTTFISKGNIGVTSSAELLERWRKVMINIDQQLIDECRDLFAMIYFSYSVDYERR